MVKAKVTIWAETITMESAQIHNISKSFIGQQYYFYRFSLFYLLFCFKRDAKIQKIKNIGTMQKIREVVLMVSSKKLYDNSIFQS